MTIRELTFQRDTFSVTTTRTPPSGITVALSGCADLRVQAEFNTLVYQVHDKARQMHVQTVAVDMGELEFLSSGCFKCLCTWARLLLERDASYKLVIYSNPKYYWQVRSLSALRMLAPDLIAVEQRGG
jgi:hypothetical protein